METNQSSTNQNLTGSEVQPQRTGSRQKLFIAVVISVLLTSVLTGSTIYFWQKSVGDKTIGNLEQKIASLEEQISTVNKEEAIPQSTSLPELPTPTPITGFARDIIVDYNGIEPNPAPNATGNITPEIKQAIETIIKSEKHTFTDRVFFTFAVYQNYNDEWIDAAISAPQSQNFITLQDEPYSRILLRKTVNGWVGHLGCAPGYLQLLVDFYQSDYIEASSELINTLNLRLTKDPNATDLNCGN